MRRLIASLLIAISAISCYKPVDLNQEYNEAVANIIGTRSDQPLLETIWEHQTDEEYNQYLYFSKDTVRFFYGIYDEKSDELQRWSDFYESEYEFYNGNILTSLTYPNYGDSRKMNNMPVLVFGDYCQIIGDGKSFNYTNYSPKDIEGQWIIIYVTIEPWK